MSKTVSPTESDRDLNDTPDRKNGLTDEQIKELSAVAGRRKGDPSMDRLMKEVEKYRETLRQEEIAAQEASARDK